MSDKFVMVLLRQLPALIYTQVLFYNQLIVLQMNWSQPQSLNTYFYTFYDFSMFLSWPTQYIQIASSIPEYNMGQNGKQSQNFQTDILQQHSNIEKKDCKCVIDEVQNSIRQKKLLQKREREDNFQKKKQKKNRNLPSNILKLFILNLFDNPNISEAFLSDQNDNGNFNLEIFVQKIKQVVKPTQNYIRPSIIQKLYSQQFLNKQQCLAFRMLIKKFLLLELPMIITPMKKYRRRQKRQILSFGRKLLDNLNQKFYT